MANTAKDESTLRKEQAEITRQKLLKSARALFSEKGYNGTSVRSISRQVGLADGILYHYFPGGKRELFQTIVIQSFKEVQNDVKLNQERLNDGEATVEQFFTEAFRLFTDTVNKNIDIIRIILKENDVQEFISAKQILSVTNSQKECIADFLKSRAMKGELRNLDFNTAASAIVSALVNYMILKAMNIDMSEIINEEILQRNIKYYMDLWKKN